MGTLLYICLVTTDATDTRSSMTRTFWNWPSVAITARYHTLASSSAQSELARSIFVLALITQHLYRLHPSNVIIDEVTTSIEKPKICHQMRPVLWSKYTILTYI